MSEITPNDLQRTSTANKAKKKKRQKTKSRQKQKERKDSLNQQHETIARGPTSQAATSESAATVMRDQDQSSSTTRDTTRSGPQTGVLSARIESRSHVATVRSSHSAGDALEQQHSTTKQTKKKKKKRRNNRGSKDGISKPATNTDVPSITDGEGSSAPLEKQSNAAAPERCDEQSHDHLSDDDDFHDDDHIEDMELQGVFIDGQMVLVNCKERAVYSAERDGNGDLVPVGLLVPTSEYRATGAGPQSDKDAAASHARLPTVGKFVILAPTLPSATHPWQATDDDHCETPLLAYQDIEPLLDGLCQQLRKPRSELRIYDPYFCAGGTKTHLASLGFTKVYNRCEDFYARIAEGTTPEHDVVVTNPPYSDQPVDHVEKLTRWLFRPDAKPFFVVQPNYVYMKPYWTDCVQTGTLKPRPFFLHPKTPRAYVYQTPAGMRKLKRQALKTSPFVSFWYCWLGHAQHSTLQHVRREGLPCASQLAMTELLLPDAFKDSNDRTRRKKRKRKHDKAAIAPSGTAAIHPRSASKEGTDFRPQYQQTKRRKHSQPSN